MGVPGVGKSDLRQTAVTLAWSTTASVLGAVVVGMVVFTLQVREPRLVYWTAEGMRFAGQRQCVATYHVSIANEGRAAAEDVVCTVSVPAASIQEWGVSAAPVLTHSQSLLDDTVWLQVPGLNPGEAVHISVLATTPDTCSGAEILPGRPEVSLRGEGVTGAERPRGAAAFAERLRDVSIWAPATAVGAAAGVGAWLVRRWRILARVDDAFWSILRGRRAPDFEDEFESWPSAWKSRSKMSVVGHHERGLSLGPISVGDLSFALLLHTEPRFADGTVECEVYLEYGALFNLVVRGDVVDDEFYMARLDSREQFWDCILFKPKGKTWRECNKGRLSHHSEFRRWTTMRVDAKGRRISVYRDDELVDQILDARHADGTVGLFAEGAHAYVRAIRIWRR